MRNDVTFRAPKKQVSRRQMPKPSQLFQGIGHHMSRVQLMSNCSHQDSWKVFLERSGGLEGAGKAPSSQLPVKKRGGWPVFNLGFHMFHRITYLGGVGQVVDSCILYHFCIFNLESWGIISNFTSMFVNLGWNPAALGDFDKHIMATYWNGVWKIPLSHEDIQLLGNFTAMLCLK